MRPNQYIIFFFFVLISTLSVNAQTNFTFGYDASGNRLTRTITLKSASISKDSIEIKKAISPLDDQIGPHQIRIYPNPTKGLLKIEIPNLGDISANLMIYSIGGALIQQVRLEGEYADIDLSSQPTGIYLLRISIGDKTSVWKIIKN